MNSSSTFLPVPLTKMIVVTLQKHNHLGLGFGLAQERPVPFTQIHDRHEFNHHQIVVMKYHDPHDRYGFDIHFDTPSLGIHLEDRKGKYGAAIYAFNRDSETCAMLPAEMSSQLDIGDVVLGINDMDTFDLPFSELLELCRNEERPVRRTHNTAQHEM